MASVEVRGVGVVLGDLGRYGTASRALGGTAYAVTSGLIYARPIVLGRFRDGRVARRAGGTFSIYRALEQIAPTIGPAIARALPAGPRAAVAALAGRALAVERETKAREAVDTGTLRRSWRTVARSASGWGPL
jgi:hypothetical protein